LKSTVATQPQLQPALPTFEDPLFFRDNTTMIFGDAKKTLQEIVSEFKAA
jgi:NAD(P) transhydrogenase subunit beta